MGNIINGNQATVESQVLIAIAINKDGCDVSTGTPILPNDLATVKSQVKLTLAVDNNGDSL